MLFFNANYALLTPSDILAERFGTGFSAGGQVELMTWPGNWIIGIDGQVGFAGKCGENVIDFLQGRGWQYHRSSVCRFLRPSSSSVWCRANSLLAN
ncbi:MAG: hypothetical protein IPJ06_20005 [Saprospiraceae bacterium]|nr:hypothetical protein [Saprospiraceae bacterium]